jgi:hypothetical protein
MEANKANEFRKKLGKKRFYLLSKGYTCRFKSEAFALFASIALRPCITTHVFVLTEYGLHCAINLHCKQDVALLVLL